MTTATITSKGQITIPAIVRSELKAAPDDRIEFIKISEGHYEIFPVTRDVKQLKGIIKSKKTISIEKINTAIKCMAAKK